MRFLIGTDIVLLIITFIFLICLAFNSKKDPLSNWSIFFYEVGRASFILWMIYSILFVLALFLVNLVNTIVK